MLTVVFCIVFINCRPRHAWEGCDDVAMSASGFPCYAHVCRQPLCAKYAAACRILQSAIPSHSYPSKHGAEQAGRGRARRGERESRKLSRTPVTWHGSWHVNPLFTYPLQDVPPTECTSYKTPFMGFRVRWHVKVAGCQVCPRAHASSQVVPLPRGASRSHASWWCPWTVKCLLGS